MKKSATIFSAFFITALALATTTVFAKTTDVATAEAASIVVSPVPISVDNCAAVAPADLASLRAIQTDSTLTATQEISQEIALRRQLLGKTATCAIQDAQALHATLDGIALPAGSGAFIKSQLAGRIDDAINFYTIESSKIDGAGINASQAIAREMLAWRAANYVPLAGDVNNFVLWAKNQKLFETADNRLTQTGHVVSFIESVAATNSGLEASLHAAQNSFADAQSANAAAGVALGQIQSPDETLALIQQSLQSLADTYQKFSDLNGLIQKLLPTNPS